MCDTFIELQKIFAKRFWRLKLSINKTRRGLFSKSYSLPRKGPVWAAPKILPCRLPISEFGPFACLSPNLVVVTSPLIEIGYFPLITCCYFFWTPWPSPLRGLCHSWNTRNFYSVFQDFNLSCWWNHMFPYLIKTNLWNILLAFQTLWAWLIKNWMSLILKLEWTLLFQWPLS